MHLLFVILMVIAALLMCFIVLIQNSKGGGLASGFSSSNAIMGVRKTTDFLEKATWGLAIFMVVMSIATAYVVPRSAVAKDAVLEQAQKEQQTNRYTYPQVRLRRKLKLLLPMHLLQKLRHRLLKLLLLQQSNSLRRQVRLWGKTINGKVQTDAAFL